MHIIKWKCLHKSQSKMLNGMRVREKKTTLFSRSLKLYNGTTFIWLLYQNICIFSISNGNTQKEVKFVFFFCSEVKFLLLFDWIGSILFMLMNHFSSLIGPLLLYCQLNFLICFLSVTEMNGCVLCTLHNVTIS